MDTHHIGVEWMRYCCVEGADIDLHVALSRPTAPARQAHKTDTETNYTLRREILITLDPLLES